MLLMEKIGPKPKKIELQLAARACLLYLSKIIVSKRPSQPVKEESETSEEKV